MRTIAAGLALGMLAAAVPALAAEREDAKELNGYVRTGETKTCLFAHSIRSTKVLNGHQILFVTRGGERYLNEPMHCGGMRKTQALSYTLTNASLCSLTIVRLIDPSSPSWEQGACGLDAFQKLEARQAAAE